MASTCRPRCRVQAGRTGPQSHQVITLGETGQLGMAAVLGELAARGVGISAVQQMGPEGTPGSRFCFFDDPDGNTRAIQEYKRA